MNDYDVKKKQAMEQLASEVAYIRTYRYIVCGMDATEQLWQFTGYVDALPAEVFHKVPQVIEAETFMRLTGGMAVFGKPGLMCKGPYKITEVTIKLREE